MTKKVVLTRVLMNGSKRQRPYIHRAESKATSAKRATKGDLDSMDLIPETPGQSVDQRSINDTGYIDELASLVADVREMFDFMVRKLVNLQKKREVELKWEDQERVYLNHQQEARHRRKVALKKTSFQHTRKV